MKTRMAFTVAWMTSILIGVWTPADAVHGEVVWFHGGPFDLSIPADPGASQGWMEDAIIEVPDHLIITDLDVRVALAHTKVFDLQLYLESPSGTQVVLNMYDPFTDYFDGADYRDTIFDDEAETPIGEASAPFEGRFIPRAPLAVFDGEDACGLWRLRVYDAFYVDTGRLEGFALAISVPEPTTSAFLLLGVAFVGSRRRFR